MGLTVALEDEHGMRLDNVEDSANTLYQLFPRVDDINSHCLRYVDRYGDTVFNRNQMNDLLRELNDVLQNTQIEKVRSIVSAIIRLARACSDTPHLYIKFYGD